MEKKTEVVIIRMGEAEKKSLVDLARDQNTTMSGVVMALIRQAALQSQDQRRHAA